MNQEKIGSFIASCRKEMNMTQAGLAEHFGITDRAVSKWETGKSLPDASIMLELCELLNITVNELLTGERLTMDNYKEVAEENLVQMAKQEELSNKKMLRMETVIGVISVVAYLMLIFAAVFAIPNMAWKVASIAVAFVIFIIGVGYAVKIEHDAGYYECQNCHERYVPTMKAVVMAPHNGRNRWMKCPYCGERSYHKKVLTK